MILILDNHDSFTYNLFHQVEMLGKKALIRQSDQLSLEEIAELSPEKIILSAGPKTPAQAGITLEAIAHFGGQIPMLGVCLGHQALGMAEGAELVGAKELVHGRAVPIRFEPAARLFDGVRKPLVAARYNSLVLAAAPEGYRATAWDVHGDLMAMEHNTKPLFGVQFHLESFMTKQGSLMMRNFLYGS